MTDILLFDKLEIKLYEKRKDTKKMEVKNVWNDLKMIIPIVCVFFKDEIWKIGFQKELKIKPSKALFYMKLGHI